MTVPTFARPGCVDVLFSTWEYAPRLPSASALIKTVLSSVPVLIVRVSSSFKFTAWLSFVIETVFPEASILAPEIKLPAFLMLRDDFEVMPGISISESSERSSI